MYVSFRERVVELMYVRESDYYTYFDSDNIVFDSNDSWHIYDGVYGGIEPTIHYPTIDTDVLYSFMYFSVFGLGVIIALMLVIVFILGWEAKAK